MNHPAACASVSLVIPCRNAGATLRACLESAQPLLARGELTEIIVVNDGSTDDTAGIAAEFPVRTIEGPCRGPGAARNAGWRQAQTDLVWFVDADCVIHNNALSRLMCFFEDDTVVGAGGSYGNMREDSLLACLIHEEIRVRHRRMSNKVDYLATFNVLYRHKALAAVGGFAEQYVAAEDAELAFRLLKNGGHLRFDVDSLVSHFHETKLRRYLRAQYRNAFYRIPLYFEHPEFASGDAYSGPADHLQPPLAMLLLVTLPLLFWSPWRWVPIILAGLLAATQIPMMFQLTRAMRQARYLAFSALGFIRAFARGFGMTVALIYFIFIKERRHKMLGLAHGASTRS